MSNLIGGSKSRMYRMRRYVQDWPRKHSTTITWRNARKHGVGSIAISCAHTQEPGARRRCIPLSVVTEWREHAYADDILRLGHQGWYADDDQDTTYRGQVWRLPHGKFIGGYADKNAEYAVIDTDTHDCERDAAHAGNNLAERDAAEGREYHERWREAQTLTDRIEQAQSDITDVRREASILVATIRATTGDIRTHWCTQLRTLRGQLHTLLASITEARTNLLEYSDVY